MAQIIDLLTLGELKVLGIDSDPRTGAGLAAEIGSWASINDGATGEMYIKTGAANTAWEKISTTTSAGTISAGVQNRLAVYPSSGNSLDDQLTFSGFLLDVIVDSHALTANRTYTMPDVGANASFVMTQGAQTIAGDKTFSDDVIVNGDLTVNGTLTYLNSTNTEVKDKLITLNKGGAATSAGGSGIEFEENSIITAYMKMASDRNGYEMKAANLSSTITLDLQNLTTSRIQKFADTAGTFVMRQTANPFVAGQIAYASDANNLTSNTDFFWDAVNNRLGINVTGAPTDSLHVDGTVRFEDLVGPNKFLKVDANGVLSAEQITLTSDVSGVLPIANGGTNSSTSLNNNRIMISSSGAIVEHSALTAGQVLYVNGSGLPEGEAGFEYNASLDQLSVGNAVIATGLTLTSIISGILHVDASGVVSSSAVDLASADVTGILPIANGGTNSSTALNNNRIMISSSGSIVEHSVQTAGRVSFYDANGLPSGSSNFLWDNATNRLSVGGSNSDRTLDVTGSGILRGSFKLVDASAVANKEWSSGTVNTTDATVTTLQSINIPVDSSAIVRTMVVGRRTGGTAGANGDAAVYVRTARYANIGGTLTVHNVSSDYTSESVPGFSATLDASGSNARVRVTGAANMNLSWQCWTEVQIQS